MKTRIVLLFSLLVCLTCACSKGISGRVSCDGKGLEGVVVSDGYDCVLTDARGRYTLERKRGVRFISVSTPAGYLPETADKTIPLDYQKVMEGCTHYDFNLVKNPLDDSHHVFIVQADAQMNDSSQFTLYQKILDDINGYVKPLRGKVDLLGFDCGDITWDRPNIIDGYISTVACLDMPIYRAIGNHDMTHGGRSFESSYSKFEEEFGPIYHSFNRGKAHYVILDNCFFIDRDYLFIGYLDERTLSWLEKDLSFVPEDNPVFIFMHIPASFTKEIAFNKLNMDELANCRGFFELLKGHKTHLITGHTHFNHNVCYSDSLMEHNTAAACGLWWMNELCTDGTPQGYGVYDVNGTDVSWTYKCAGFPSDYQFRISPVGSDPEYPKDLIVNVWNYDEKWKVEWSEAGGPFMPMTQFTGNDMTIKKVIYSGLKDKIGWLDATRTVHLFRAAPIKGGPVVIRVTDRFGNVYQETYGI